MMTKLVAVIGAVVALCASAIAQYSNGWSSYNDPLTGPIRFSTVFQGQDSALNTMGTWVIADQGAWDNFWLRHRQPIRGNQGSWGNGNQGNYRNNERAPQLCNFEREQLIIVHLGTQHAGTSVYIDRIDRPDSWHFDVYFATTQMVLGRPSNADCSPYVIVKTARLGGTPRFFPVQNNWQSRYGNVQQGGCATHVCRRCRHSDCGGGCGCGFGGPIVYGPSGAIISGVCRG
ncbi:MAG: hypothetical protein KF812_00065 [Fimbriimonadaceae bacterium]|nr:hypothetical protein [Fimbriimonadaceae bacterium]